MELCPFLETLGEEAAPDVFELLAEGHSTVMRAGSRWAWIGLAGSKSLRHGASFRPTFLTVPVPTRVQLSLEPFTQAASLPAMPRPFSWACPNPHLGRCSSPTCSGRPPLRCPARWQVELIQEGDRRGRTSLEILLLGWLEKRAFLLGKTQRRQGKAKTKQGADSGAERFRRRVIFRQEIAPSAAPGPIIIHLVNVHCSS